VFAWEKKARRGELGVKEGTKKMLFVNSEGRKFRLGTGGSLRSCPESRTQINCLEDKRRRRPSCESGEE